MGKPGRKIAGCFRSSCTGIINIPRKSYQYKAICRIKYWCSWCRIFRDQLLQFSPGAQNRIVIESLSVSESAFYLHECISIFKYDFRNREFCKQ